MKSTVDGLRTNSPFIKDTTVQDVLSRLVRQLSELLGYGIITTMVFDEETQTLQPGPGYESFGEPFRRRMSDLPLGKGCCGKAAAEQRVVIVSDTHRNDMWKSFVIVSDTESIRSVWSIPMVYGSRLFGTVAVYHTKVHTPSSREIQIARWLATHAVTALTEIRLRESEQRYKSLFEENPDAVYSLDLDGKLTSANASYEKLTGYTVKESLGGDILQLIVDSDKAKMKSCFERAKRGHSGWTEVGFVRRDQQRADAQVTHLPVMVDGRISGVFGIAKDITDRKQAEEALRRSERKLRQAHRIANIGTWERDLSSDKLVLSDEVCQFFGIPCGQPMPFESIKAFVHPDDLPMFLEEARQSRIDGNFNIQFRITSANGDIRTLHTCGEPVIDHGKIVRLFGTIQDITERQRTDTALAESENRLTHAQRIAQLGYWDWDCQFETENLTWSNETYRIFGVEPQNFGGRYESFLRFVHPEDQEMVTNRIMEALKGAPFEIEYRILRGDGQERIIQTQADVFRDHAGNPVRMIGVLQDITERVRAEHRIQASEQRYKSLVRYNQDGICALNLDGTFVEVNPAFEQMTGYSSKELESRKFTDILYRKDVPRAAEFIQASFDGGQAFLELSMKRRDGAKVEAVMTVAPIVVNQQSVGVYAIIKDVTLQKETEELLRRSEKLSVVGQMAAGVAHEIRNPLTALKGFMKLLEESSPTDSKARGYLDIMRQEIERIEFISGELLVLAKPQSLQYSVVNLCEVLEDVTTLLQTQAILECVEIRFERKFDFVPVECVENQLKQVFVNLIKNAIEAMPDGGVVNIWMEATNGRAVIQVVDSGKGIPSDILARLGEPFYTTKEKGTGLGLMVTHKIIENHNGSIQFSSTVGRGTCVHIELPIFAAFAVEPRV